MIASRSRPIAHPADLGRFAPSLLFALLIVSYAAIGRDVFFNRLQASNVDDPIGANLVYIRCLVAASCLWIVFVRKGLWALIGLLPVGWLPFAIFALASAAWSDDPKTTAREALQLVAFIWAVSCCLSELGKKAFFRLLWSLCGFFLVMSALIALTLPSIGVHSGTEFVQFSHSGRWKGVFVHKNALGFYAAVSTFWFVLLIIKRVPLIVGGFALICSSLCLIYAGSSTSIGVFCFLLFAYPILSLRHRVSCELFSAVLVILVVVSYVVFTYLFDAVLGLLGRDAGLSGRVDLWSISQNVIFDALFFGQGYSSNGGSVFNGLASQYLGAATLGAESSYLTLVLDTGLVGAMLFLFPVCKWVSGALRRDASCRSGAFESRALLLLALGALLLGYTEATAFSATNSVGALCMTSFVFLNWQAQSGAEQ